MCPLLSARANEQVPVHSPIHSSIQGRDARTGTARNGLWAKGFHRDRRGELVGTCSLKRTGPVGLVGLQRCRTNYMWASLAELKGAPDYTGAFQKMKLGKEQPFPVV